MTNNFGYSANNGGPLCRRRPRDWGMFFFSILTLLPRNCQPFHAERLLLKRGPFIRIQHHDADSDSSASFGTNTFRHREQKTCSLYQSSSSLQESADTRSNRKSNYREDPKTLERKIVELGRRGFTDEALAIYYAIPQPTIRLMNSAIDACARARPTRLEEAFKILKASPSSSIQPNVFTFGALMSACARARRGDRARALLKSMEVRVHDCCRFVLFVFYLSCFLSRSQ